MSDLRAGIVRLYQEGHRVMEISRLMNVPHQTVSHAIKRFEQTGSNDDGSRNGRPATATTEENIRLIADRFCYCNDHDPQIHPGTEGIIGQRVGRGSPRNDPNAIDAFPKRLRKCIETQGGHFIE